VRVRHQKIRRTVRLTSADQPQLMRQLLAVLPHSTSLSLLQHKGANKRKQRKRGCKANEQLDEQ
jgi:hypothetical protein